jgi:hypothetical protein
MKPVETVSWHQSAQPIRNPLRGPTARLMME